MSYAKRVWLTVLAVSLGAGPVSADIPEKFTNLKELNPEISRDELIATMRQFSTALGVRCNFCHMQAENSDELDFAADGKEEKDAARVMMRMTKVINGDWISKVAEEGHPSVQVECVTCHRGQPHPRLIEDVLADAYTAGGFDSLQTKYAELRNRYYGSQTFDFSDRMLSELGHQIGGDDASIPVRLAELNVQWSPESSMAYVYLAMAHSEADDVEQAKADIAKALELDPKNRWAMRLREQLDAPPGQHDEH